VSECQVDGCGRPVTDAYVCSDCSARLEKALGNVRWLLHELDLVITRQTAKAEHVGGASREQPLAFSAEASDLRWALVNTVTTWARVVATERPVDLPTKPPRHRGEVLGPYCEDCEHETCARMRYRPPVDPGLVAAWMTGQVEWLRHHRAGNEAVEEITSVIRRALRAIDVAPARLYAGPCSIDTPSEPCGQDLYADPMSAVVTCPACGKRYDVTERKAWLMEAARDHLATANEASALCYKLLGDLVTTAMIRGYVHRGKLAPHGKRMEGSRDVALYRIGDVIDVASAARWDEREQRATRKAGAA
jgi:hypothetical protein